MSNGLGRGLGSLIPQKNNQTTPQNNEADISNVSIGNDKDKVLQVEIEKIKVNPMQPRQEFESVNLDGLVESIKEYGVIQPLIVSQASDGYELIAGERRLRAAKAAGLRTVPVIVRDAKKQEKLEIALVENLQRQNLNPIETAIAYRKLVDEFNISQAEVSRKVGKARSSITNTLRMLNLPEEIKAALVAGKIGEGHAKYLLGLDSEEKQMILFKKILHNNLTVNDTHKEVKRMGGTREAKIKINYADKDKELSLREFFGAKTEIKRKLKGGEIVIDFYSDDELEEIMKKVGARG